MYQVFREKSILELALHFGRELLSTAVREPLGLLKAEARSVPHICQQKVAIEKFASKNKRPVFLFCLEL